MSDLIVIEELKAYLIAHGVVQDQPGVPGSALPVVWLDPRDGAPEPESRTAPPTVTLRRGVDVVLPALHEWLDSPVVDVIVRAHRAPQGELVQRQIKHLLHEKKLLVVGQLQTEYIEVWRGTQPLAADGTSYTTLQSFRIEARVKALAGIPYVP